MNYIDVHTNSYGSAAKNIRIRRRATPHECASLLTARVCGFDDLTGGTDGATAGGIKESIDFGKNLASLL